jgi:hypothetical protein
MASATITVTGNYQNGRDTLAIDSGDLIGVVTANWEPVSGTLTLAGPASKADYEFMLEHVTYTNSSGDPDTGDRTVSWTVCDGTCDSAVHTTKIGVSQVSFHDVLV